MNAQLAINEAQSNAAYLLNVTISDNAEIVTTLEKIVADYNIKKIAVYNVDSNNTYDVVFEDATYKIKATYTKTGEVIKTFEEFNNIKLPLQLSTEILRKYPNWAFSSNKQTVTYEKDKGAIKIYTVEIQNNTTIKSLKFNVVSSPEINYVAINN
tara:strand:+ start:418 stop:882 length:465 start_codon:yes stop_codon:yes gene_type:complete